MTFPQINTGSHRLAILAAAWIVGFAAAYAVSAVADTAVAWIFTDATFTTPKCSAISTQETRHA